MNHFIQPLDIALEDISTPYGSVAHMGPPLSHGKLPSLFYFALTGRDSLSQDPYNQPARMAASTKGRIFSITLPEHGGNEPDSNAMHRWALRLLDGDDFVSPFIVHCKKIVDFLIEEGYIDIDHLAVAGLSRGGFMATHLAASDARFKYLLAFAPLTDLYSLKELAESSSARPPLVDSLNLMSLIDQLHEKTVRFYIGNRDTRVSTARCCEFIIALSDAAYNKRHRSPPIELHLFPSIGHRGHGTPPHIFQSGIDWIKMHLSLSSNPL